MSDTNYVSGVVKILETPKQKILNNKIMNVEFRAQLPQVRQSRLVKLVVWGKLANDIVNYYRTNDYIVVEGYISLRPKPNPSSVSRPSKKVEITVLKIYPFLLSYS